MLSGDELSTQYFIASIAIAVIGIAITQSGWNHRRFIQISFASGILLALIALLWGIIIDLFPKFGNAANSIGGRSFSWLVLFFASVGIIFWFNYRTQQHLLSRYFKNSATPDSAPMNLGPTVDEKEWFSAIEITKFADQKLVVEHNEISIEIAEAAKELEAAQRALDAVTAEVGPLVMLQNPQPPEYAKASTRSTAANNQYYSLTTRRDGLYATIVRDICTQLSNGSLVAKGFKPPVLFDDDEVVIPRAQWRLLSFDKSLSKAEADGISYVGIAVAQA